MPGLLVISNSAAGTADDEAVAAAVEVLSGAYDVTVKATSGTDELEALLRDADIERVVTVGGDGSVHAVVATLHHLGALDRVTIGLIPCGTGNDLARTLGLSHDPAAAARQYLDSTVRTLDLVLDDQGGVVVNAVHIGLGAEAARKGQAWKARLGRAGYVLGAIKAGFLTRGLDVAVELDGTRVRRPRRGSERIAQLAIGNGRYVGGGAELVPAAEPDNAQLEVLVSFANRPLDRLAYALRLRRGTHDERHDVVTAVAAEVVVHGADPFWVNADGEVCGPMRSIGWRVEPAAWRMQAPSDPAAADGLGTGLEA